MADPLPPRPAAGRRRRRQAVLAALALLTAAPLLTGCAAGARPTASAPAHPPVHRSAAGPTAPVPPAAAQPAPVRVLAVAYSASTPAPPVPAGRAPARLRAGAAERRPHPVPGRPAAPGRPQPPAPAAAQRGLPAQQPGVCELGRHYGGWPAGSPQEAVCRAVYG